MTPQPLVSVIIPACNAEPFIGDAVASALAQGTAGLEVIVVDDGSTDGTAAVVRTYGAAVRYARQPNRGVSAARNRGIELARGEFVCLLDADDRWLPGKLERQLALFDRHPSLGLVFADAEERDGSGIQKASILDTMQFGAAAVSQVPLADAFRKLLEENFIPTSTVILRRECVTAVGGFDEDLPNAEDRDLWLRVAARFGIGCVPQVLAVKRSHGANISARTQLALQSRITVWTQNRRRFPELAPAAVYDRLLAGTYQQLGYIYLSQSEGRAARQCGRASLLCAVRAVIAMRQRFAYRWWLSVCLVPMSLFRWSMIRRLWHVRNRLLRRPADRVLAG